MKQIVPIITVLENFSHPQYNRDGLVNSTKSCHIKEMTLIRLIKMA